MTSATACFGAHVRGAGTVICLQRSIFAIGVPRTALAIASVAGAVIRVIARPFVRHGFFSIEDIRAGEFSHLIEKVAEFGRSIKLEQIFLQFLFVLIASEGNGGAKLDFITIRRPWVFRIGLWNVDQFGEHGEVESPEI